ncbi:unnamed protein product [Prorocentrum cordatum]|uniref:Uncharacterized protein n=1 Tax=Prorocentrum cordatum TaxID=2364126 RepID=A0ABN9PM88_9DINO|nr:unnamed protein product [Polarella glacialis]
MDLTPQEYTEFLPAQGAAKGMASDVLSGIQHLLKTKRQMPGAWRLPQFSVWGRLEVPSRAPPMPPLACTALPGRGLAATELAFASVVIAAFHLCLRTGEALNLCGDLISLRPDRRGVVSPPMDEDIVSKRGL